MSILSDWQDEAALLRLKVAALEDQLRTSRDAAEVWKRVAREYHAALLKTDARAPYFWLGAEAE